MLFFKLLLLSLVKVVPYTFKVQQMFHMTDKSNAAVLDPYIEIVLVNIDRTIRKENT